MDIKVSEVMCLLRDNQLWNKHDLMSYLYQKEYIIDTIERYSNDDKKLSLCFWI